MQRPLDKSRAQDWQPYNQSMSRQNLIIISLVLLITLSFNVEARQYYVDAESGNDANVGNSSSTPWKTLAKVSQQAFLPGDEILLKRGCTWRGTLVISSSGAPNAPITYTAYGSGQNPLITTAELFSDWKPITEGSKVIIWRGTIETVRNAWGAEEDGKRLPRYYKYNQNVPTPDHLEDMVEGYFYAPLNRGEFFLRRDSGPPGKIEVGARKYGILVKNKKHVVIDSIDVTGPGGREDVGNQELFSQVFIDSAFGITVKNSILNNHINHGIMVIKSQDCLIENVVSYGHGSTGLYFWESGPGNKIIACRVHQCGNLHTDTGDMGLIGIFRTPNVVVERCILSRNGHANPRKLDAAVSFVQSPHGRVNRCHFERIGGTVIQFAENSDGGMAAYNIIDQWGVSGAQNSNEGIRIGGGYKGSTAKNCKIYNNLFINGGSSKGEWAALRVLYYENEGLEVRNNIFYDNQGIYEVYAESRDKFQNWAFTNNLYYRTSGHAVKWADKLYDALHLIGIEKGYLSFDRRQEAGTKTGNPLLELRTMSLNKNSPCIDAGINAGLSLDFHGRLVPNGKNPDIGPFEYRP
jgi:hypothetical protein